MAKKRTLSILLVVAVALALAYGVFTLFLNNKTNSESGIEIFSADTGLDKISAESYGGYTIVKVGDEWQLEGDSKFPLNSGAVQTMINALTPLYATAQVSDNLLSEQEYGFDEPYNKVTLTSGATTTVLTFGDINAYTTNTYITVTGHDKLYTVSADVVVAFDKDLLSLIEPEVWPVTGTAQISSVRFINSEQPQSSYSVEIQRTDDDTQPVKYFVTAEDESFYAENDPASILIHSLVSIYYTQCVHYNATQNELETYGLGEPFLTLDITATDYDGEDISQVLQIGTMSENGAYFVKLENSNTVYEMDAFVLQEVIDTSAQSLKEKSTN